MSDIERNEEAIVEDDDRYVMASPGIMVANDRSALREYYKNAESNRRKQEELNTMKSEVADLSTRMDRIENLLLDLRDKLEDRD